MTKNVASVSTGLVGGVTLIPSQFTVFSNGHIVLVDMDIVLPHSVHITAVVPSTSMGVYVCGRRILRIDDIASCGEPMTLCEQGLFAG